MNNQSPDEEWDELAECLDTPPSKAGEEAERRQVREKADAKPEVAKELADFDSPTMSESEVEVRRTTLEVRDNAFTLMKRVDERRKGLSITQMTDLSKESRASGLVAPTSSAKDARRALTRRKLQA